MLAQDPDTRAIAKHTDDERTMQLVANWMLAPLPAAAAFFLTGVSTWWVFAAIGLGLAVFAKLAMMFTPAMRDYVFSFCFVGHPILLTTALAGHGWQMDSHMLFFAVLAIVSTLSNARALIFATVLVALHHVSLSLLLPELVYPGGSIVENLQRTTLHAALVLLETGVLLVSILKRNGAETALLQERIALQDQTAVAEQSRMQANKNEEDARVVVEALHHHLDDLSQGKLDSRIGDEFPPKYSDLRDSFNAAVQTLSDTLQQVAGAATHIKTSASSMGESSGELSTRSETQAATLEQTAAALEQMTLSLGQAAKGSQDAKTKAAKTRSEAESSGDIVKQAVDAMKAIEESSTKISNIIGVIDDIAFQTNLLALNAGVEAARAGDAGKGFAVVATEVRGLAQRSADSATEIKDLIEQSSQQVRNGVQFVDKAGVAIDGIVARVNDISAVIATLAGGTEEQARGLTEINDGVSNLDTVTQRNAAMASALMSSGRDLNSHAVELANLMQRFQFQQNATRAAA